ncbi:MAG: hypothetical protein PSX81_06635 [bacterium]|nr:hypothetical protein [bacterium]
MITFLDFDGTIVEHEYPAIGNCVEGCYTVIAKLQKAGHKIILNSYRSQSKSGKLKNALEHINKKGQGIINPIIEFSKSKVNPFYWNWEIFMTFGFIFIDDDCLGIPVKNANAIEGRQVVDWQAVDRQFEENGIYSTHAVKFFESTAA